MAVIHATEGVRTDVLTSVAPIARPCRLQTRKMTPRLARKAGASTVTPSEEQVHADHPRSGRACLARRQASA